MAVEWCPNCRRIITQPSFNQTSAYAKFVRDHRCCICDSPLRSVGESPRSTNPTTAATAANPPAEPQSRPIPAYDSARKDEVDRLRFEYKTRFC
jgi:hypothetical protein